MPTITSSNPLLQRDAESNSSSLFYQQTAAELLEEGGWTPMTCTAMSKTKAVARLPSSASLCSINEEENEKESASSTLDTTPVPPQAIVNTPVAEVKEAQPAKVTAEPQQEPKKVDPDHYNMSDVPLPKGYSVRQLRALAENNGKGAVQKLMKLATETEGWIPNGTHKGVACEMKNVGEDNMFVCRGTVNFGSKFNAFDFLDYIRNWDSIQQYDPMFSEGRILCEFDWATAVTYMSFKGMLLFDGRDFVTSAHAEVVDERTVAQAATAFELWPEAQAPSNGKRSVRMNVAMAGFVLKHLEDGTLQVTSVMVADLKLKLPKKVMEKAPFLVDQPAALGKIKTLMYKEGVKVNPLRPWDLVEKVKPLAGDVRTEAEAVRRKYHVRA
uniref:START domain-containing protein n=1 Tax=Chromera velia CCMP2878 TaxID=1169474 RepID=A0A0G4FAN2_9ALVE|mmetsp:Transcript_16257/g.32946  ORF Transcript_16257/g.32946 Transcript_16257/m.32946 type:complete len:384 (-) Transcript_16257:1030-2181(-)|eukprot:Cvel_3029.t1-p1 / transcript=Cvel_3029.t1 / gene=Cvel_3029 / organism=Chromera_velia_CCMP2878 / gene_product=hypothetical protein / transcript_product=hypothetical protein / location=Cvel_scaffold121:30285-32774(+) / protein_length=383 / sequence_SO=supercontig / SO=protein_coding / is_pseudo=false